MGVCGDLLLRRGVSPASRIAPSTCLMVSGAELRRHGTAPLFAECPFHRSDDCLWNGAVRSRSRAVRFPLRLPSTAVSLGIHFDGGGQDLLLSRSSRSSLGAVSRSTGMPFGYSGVETGFVLFD